MNFARAVPLKIVRDKNRSVLRLAAVRIRNVASFVQNEAAASSFAVVGRQKRRQARPTDVRVDRSVFHQQQRAPTSTAERKSATTCAESPTVRTATKFARRRSRSTRRYRASFGSKSKTSRRFSRRYCVRRKRKRRAERRRRRNNRASRRRRSRRKRWRRRAFCRFYISSRNAKSRPGKGTVPGNRRSA